MKWKLVSGMLSKLKFTSFQAYLLQEKDTTIQFSAQQILINHLEVPAVRVFAG